MLKGILNWLGAKTGVVGANDYSPVLGAKGLSPVRPAGTSSFEPLEPRLLLSVDLPVPQPLLTCDVHSLEHAVYVDLDQQDPDSQADLAPIATIDVASGTRIDQPVPASAPSETPAAQSEYGILTEKTQSNSSGITPGDSATPIALAQEDAASVLESSPTGIRGPPDLPGLRLVDSDISTWRGQRIYLDFDGERDVTYHGPVTVGPFDVPAFQAPGELAGQEQTIIADILTRLGAVFTGSGITFTTERPQQGIEYSTIYIGGDDSAFSEYGSFLGVAEEIDVANPDADDDALVFTDDTFLSGLLAEGFVQALAMAVAHESGHLLGYSHAREDPRRGLLAPVAAEDPPTTRGELTFRAEGATLEETLWIHWPGTAESGVTIGRGYDLGGRTSASAIQDLVEAGVVQSRADAIGAAAGLKGEAAANFVSNNRDPIGPITLDQQQALFDLVYPRYVTQTQSNYEYHRSHDAVTGVLLQEPLGLPWGSLHWAIQDVLVDFVYQGYGKPQPGYQRPMRAGMNNNPDEMINYIQTTPKMLQWEPGRQRIPFLLEHGPRTWPVFLHDPKHTGRSPYEGPQTSAVAWTYRIGEERNMGPNGGTAGLHDSPISGPLGAIYVGSYIDGQARFLAINPDGTLKWNAAVYGGGTEGIPALGSDGAVYFTTSGGVNQNGLLYCLNPYGSLRWTGKDASLTHFYLVQTGLALASDGTIYLCDTVGSALAAVNPNGTLKWRFPLGARSWSSPAIAGDGTIYVGQDDHVLYAVNPDGSQKWSIKLSNVASYYAYSPAVGEDGTVYFGDWDKFYAITPSGQVIWRVDLGATSSPAMGTDGTIYVGGYLDSQGGERGLAAIDRAGTIKWSFPVNGSLSSSPAIGSDGTIYFGSSEYDPDYVGCPEYDDSHVYALNSDGTLKWKYKTGGFVVSSPLITSDGKLVVSSWDGNLYAFGTTDANGALVVGAIGHQTIDEETLLTFTVAGGDVGLPPRTPTFSLVDAPWGAAIDAETGVFTWTPSEAQGPLDYTFTIQVSDGVLTAAETFTVTVEEVNVAPVLAFIGNRTGGEETQLGFTATATDADIPAQPLTFSLSGAPAGAIIDAESGVFTWTPTEAQGPGNYTFAVVVTDGLLTDSETITITVQEVNAPPVPLPGFQVGDIVRTTADAVRVRDDDMNPKSWPSGSETRTVLPFGIVGKVIDGPRAHELDGREYIFWKIDWGWNRYCEPVEGWSAQDFLDQTPGAEDGAYWLARMITSEAGPYDELEREAVGWTAVNRRNANLERWGGNTIYGVVTKKGQYSLRREPTDAIRDLAREILSSNQSDPTDDAVMFFSPQSMSEGYGPFRIPGTDMERLIPDWAIPTGYTKDRPPPTDWVIKPLYRTIDSPQTEWIGPLDLNHPERNDYFMFYRPWISELGALIHSPGELRVYDAEGRCTGLVNGIVVADVPSSEYVDGRIIIHLPTGPYEYEVVGTSKGIYGLTINARTKNEDITFTGTGIPTLAGSVDRYAVDWESLLLGQDGLTMTVDSDGDAAIDYVLTAANQLTFDTSGNLVTTGSPIVLCQVVATPDHPFELAFDYQFLTMTGTVDVTLNSVILGTIEAPPELTGEPRTFSVMVSDPALLGLEEAALAFRLSGPTNSQVTVSSVSLTDRTAPVVTVNSLTTTHNSPALTGTIDDPAAAVVVTVGGRDYSAVNSGGTWTLAAGTVGPLAQDTHEVIVTATDSAGNVGTATGTIIVAPAGPRRLSVDIYPNRAVNQVYLSRNYTLYVVVFGTGAFNVMDLDWTTVRFGRTGTEARAVRAPLLRDMNGDGILDALYGFMTFDCGFQMGDTEGILTAKLNDGTDASGEDSVFVSP